MNGWNTVTHFAVSRAISDYDHTIIDPPNSKLEFIEIFIVTYILDNRKAKVQHYQHKSLLLNQVFSQLNPTCSNTSIKFEEYFILEINATSSGRY
jgi:hypothetical protein